jgi:type VI secretion system protein VasG
MSLDTLPEQLTRLQAQLTALAMEQQALLEDISLGNAVDTSRLPQIEQLTQSQPAENCPSVTV